MTNGTGVQPMGSFGFRGALYIGWRWGFVLAAIVVCPAPAGAVDLVPSTPPTLQWTRQPGTSSEDWSSGVSADGLGSAYISGYTLGSLGAANLGSRDPFIAKYDAAGGLTWTRQWGTTSEDVSYDVSADGQGNVYAAGYTAGNLIGTNAGSYDAFMTKYSASGTLLWNRRIGTSGTDEARRVSADGLGNVYMSGLTSGNLGASNAGSYDAFLTRYDASGNLVWTRQLGTSSWDESDGLSADGLGNIYIVGITSGSLVGTNAGSDDAFVAKYNAAGNLLWTRQFGTSGLDGANGVSADDLGNIFVAGYTRGNLAGTNAGSNDAFLAKYDASGNLAWTRQLGTENSDTSQGVSADGLGNVYLLGSTLGSLGGDNAGNADTFVAKYSASGDLLWTRQLGTNRYDWGGGISTDGLNNFYITGRTGGSLGGAFAGGEWDAYVGKFAEVPEPCAVAVQIVGAFFVLVVSRRR